MLNSCYTAWLKKIHCTFFLKYNIYDMERGQLFDEYEIYRQDTAIDKHYQQMKINGNLLFVEF